VSQLDRHLTTEQLSDWLDDQFPSDEQAALKTHLTSCTQCQQELAALRQTVEFLHALPQPALPRSFALPDTIAQDQPEPVALAAYRPQRGRQGNKISATLRILSSLVAVIGIFFVASGFLTTIPFLATTGASGPAVTHPQTGLDPNSRLVTPKVTGTGNGHITPSRGKAEQAPPTSEATPPAIPPAKQQVQPQREPAFTFFDLKSQSVRLALGIALFILGCCGFMYFKRQRTGTNVP
jgi:hypothetical protein